MPQVGGKGRTSKASPKATRGGQGRGANARGAAAVSSPAWPVRATAVAAAGVAILGCGAFLMLGGGAEAVARTVDEAIDGRLAAMGFRLKAVHVQGASADAIPAIQASLLLYRGQPLARLDLNAVKARVETVGWVKDARVVRLLPDTLVIAVEQRTPLAVWQHEGVTRVIDSEGVLIPEADAGRFGALPLVVGEGADQAAAEVIPLVRARPRLLTRLEALIRVDTRRWDLRLKDGSLIQLPATEEDAALIQLDQLDQRARVLELGFARIDLRDPEMIAVRPRDFRAANQPAYGGA